MSDNNEEVEKILSNAERTLETALLGYKKFKDVHGEERLTGLRNAVVFGRSVTFVLQNLSTPVGRDLDEWYAWVQYSIEGSIETEK